MRRLRILAPLLATLAVPLMTAGVVGAQAPDAGAPADPPAAGPAAAGTPGPSVAPAVQEQIGEAGAAAPNEQPCDERPGDEQLGLF